MSGKTARVARQAAGALVPRHDPARNRMWRRWRRHAAWGAAAVVVAGIVTVIAFSLRSAGGPATVTDIAGVSDFHSSNPGSLTRNHKQGVQQYQQSPPVGGDHNPVWQNCSGTVYDALIANEHAVHSLEHGAVWITYRPGLPADQVAALAAKVRGVDYMFMSPYEGLDTPISVQAWGYLLKVDSASDKRIDEFINATRIKRAPEPGATCTGGITAIGTTPQDTTGQGMAQKG